MADNMLKIPGIFLETPLYKCFTYDHDLLIDLVGFNNPIDSFCVQCKKESTFQFVNGPSDDYIATSPRSAYKNKTANYLFRCSRNSSHLLHFVLYIGADTIQKIGQYPSLADLASSDIKKYRKILDDDTYSELARAVGLDSHGIGIGSFVYLRRIFERLIEEAHKEAQRSASWNEGIYSQSKTDKKIPLLREHLPEFLVENKVMYGILSKGIHELSEDECLGAFPILKNGIELILEEKIAAREKKKKIDAITKGIHQIHQNLKTPESDESGEKA